MICCLGGPILGRLRGLEACGRLIGGLGRGRLCSFYGFQWGWLGVLLWVLDDIYC